MNQDWRSILRNRELASVRIHRKPYVNAVLVQWRWIEVPRGASTSGRPIVQMFMKPYIEIVFKKEYADKYLFDIEEADPEDRLLGFGFEDMEFFDIRVGVETDEAFMQRIADENKSK